MCINRHRDTLSILNGRDVTRDRLMYDLYPEWIKMRYTPMKSNIYDRMDSTHEEIIITEARSLPWMDKERTKIRSLGLPSMTRIQSLYRMERDRSICNLHLEWINTILWMEEEDSPLGCTMLPYLFYSRKYLRRDQSVPAAMPRGPAEIWRNSTKRSPAQRTDGDRSVLQTILQRSGATTRPQVLLPRAHLRLPLRTLLQAWQRTLRVPNIDDLPRRT